jgi:hypothetical protein
MPNTKDELPTSKLPAGSFSFSFGAPLFDNV